MAQTPGTPPRAEQPVEPPPEPVTIEAQGFRFAPTVHILFLSWGPPVRGDPSSSLSVRTGLRFATLPRPAESYQANLGVSLELGLESVRDTTNSLAQLGFGITARGGLSAVSPRGLFFPFFDAYVLTTLVFVSAFGGPAVPVMKLGLGFNLNALAILRGGEGSLSSFSNGNWGSAGYVLLAILFILLPNLEFVVTLPSAVNPVATGEVRLGIGF